MPYKSTLSFGLILLASLLLAACGSIATPSAGLPPTQEPVTLPPRLVQESSGAGEAVASQPTAVPPPPTATPLPPTEAPTEAPTLTPTATYTPTRVPPTVAPASASGGGDPALGEALFHAGKDGAPACTTCHYVDQDQILIGPSMVGIAAQAATRVAGESAEEYLHNSIVAPNAYLVPNTDTRIFAAGGASLMFQQYAEYLTAEDVDNLVAYMLTLP